MFVWRHIDHDQNIIDKASYIDYEIRRRVVVLTGASVLDFDGLLRARRHSRARRIGPLVFLGNEHVIMLLLVAGYLAVCWYVRISWKDYAGSAQCVRQPKS